MQIVDSYSESNYNNTAGIGVNYNASYGQAFTGDGGVLNSVKFFLRKLLSPTGNAVVKIYAETHATAFGTDSLPTGSVLATSETLDVSTLPQAPAAYQLFTLNFTGVNKITLTAGVYYVVVIEYGGGDASNYVGVGRDTTSPTHSGNAAYSLGGWQSDSTKDTCFYVYKDDAIGPFPTFFRTP